MTQRQKAPSHEEMRCANCRIRRFAEGNPEKIMARVWKWHTGWCPGWNAYQNALAAVQEPVFKATSGT